MELVTLQAQIRAARQVTAESDGAKFTLELPSEHAWRIALESHRDSKGRLMQSEASYAVLSAAITGWEGVTARHLLSDAPDDPLPFSASARSELLDARQDIADELIAEIGTKLAERREKRDAARKN